MRGGRRSCRKEAEAPAAALGPLAPAAEATLGSSIPPAGPGVTAEHEPAGLENMDTDNVAWLRCGFDVASRGFDGLRGAST